MKIVFMTLALIATMCASCAKSNFPAKPEDYHAVMSLKYIEDITWSPDDGCFTLEYSRESGSFDSLLFYEETGRNIYYHGYLACDIEPEVLGVLRQDLKAYEQASTEDRYAIDSKYSIGVYWYQFPDGSLDVRFEVLMESWPD